MVAPTTDTTSAVASGQSCGVSFGALWRNIKMIRIKMAPHHELRVSCPLFRCGTVQCNEKPNVDNSDTAEEVCISIPSLTQSRSVDADAA